VLFRSLVDSLPPLSGEVRWGYGCQLGIYAQHVYTSLPESQTVLEYLEFCAARGTKSQHILDLAGALLFRGEQVEKPISVLSGGERARLCLAGLLLGNHNVLILDEPGNHLDVDTVDALAKALVDYRGTVVFTSHDRHFLKRVATSIVEVRDGRVVNYRGNYEAYLYSINQEIDDAEQQLPARQARTLPEAGKPSKTSNRATPRDERARRKEMATLEKTISRLEGEKRSTNEQLLAATDPAQALRLHQELASLSAELETAEQRWFRLQD
jgi:ATP-binding cassette, subfamily F, member 3